MLNNDSLKTDQWHERVRALLQACREARGITLRELDVPGLQGGVMGKIERGVRVNLYWRQVHAACEAYQANPLLLLDLSDKFIASSWPDDAPSFDEWGLIIRQRVRQWRGRTLGTPTLAKQAGVHHSWIIRIESGEVEQIDLIRLHRVFRVLGRSLAEAFTP